MTQYFFVDESGEPGFHHFRGSPYFVLVMVQTTGWNPIPELVALRKELHLSQSFEFHYSKMPYQNKAVFYQAILPVAFRVRAAVVLKDSIPIRFQALSGFDVTVELITNLTLRASPLDICNDILIIDGATDALRTAIRVGLSEACRRYKRERPFKKIVTANSYREDGLQLADMIAGAIRDKAWQKDYFYYRSFAGKIVDEWEVK